MSSQRKTNKLVSASARIYRRMLHLYPKRFRMDYAPLMEQLFRDECRDACERNVVVSLAKLWVRVAADMAMSICREHVCELQKTMGQTMIKKLLQRPRLTSTKIFAMTSVLLAGAVATAVVFWWPRSYSSTVRIAVEKSTPPTPGSDPYFLQAEIEKIKSTAVLNEVIKKLGLRAPLAQQSGSATALTTDETYQRLKRMVDIRQSRNTTLIEVRVLSEDRVAAAQIANTIADVYRRQTSAAKNAAAVELVDAAEPGVRPVRPNVPLGLSVGWICSVMIATFVALLFRHRLSRKAPTGPVTG